MRILFDHQIYHYQNYGGISRYFYELSKGLLRLDNDCQNTIFLSENEFTTEKSLYNSRKFIPFEFRGKGSIKKYLNQKVSENIIKKGKYDIFHPTYYDTYFLDGILGKRPFVVTFYDLIHEKFSHRYPDILTGFDQVLANRKKLLKEASAIIAISNSTKRDIIEYYGIDENRIHVTYLANSVNAADSEVASANKLGDYILFVGNRGAYKNFNTFIEAIQPLLIKERNIKVICAGGGAFQQNEISLLSSLNIQNQVSQVPINDNSLASLYTNALLFAFPSLYEGFGIPVLEAFSNGCPTILSKVSSLPEIGEDAALYFDPENKENILEQVEKFIYSPGLREEYKIKGLEQAKKFSWDLMSAQTLDIYKSIL
ncbi:glycosyltransferase family 1 protein [Dyadobacter sp. CY356]|uniref:glycosyltransferase family 4 protein n=1 Tax=Dyadobacter sp. CY356 TaxID=2906442 RepID=UPI001F30E573|nr:glycosyltransferase family 1 protein [Dyadobacter sp. CY356]MCF0058310.1 glycosyltransferase family 4 protein [Dyadobacter sp. CY356]